MGNSNKEKCCLCGSKHGELRNAYRALRGKVVTRDGFYPRTSFTYEEISKMAEGTYNEVCSSRRKCLAKQGENNLDCLRSMNRALESRPWRRPDGRTNYDY